MRERHARVAIVSSDAGFAAGLVAELNRCAAGEQRASQQCELQFVHAPGSAQAQHLASEDGLLQAMVFDATSLTGAAAAIAEVALLRPELDLYLMP